MNTNPPRNIKRPPTLPKVRYWPGKGPAQKPVDSDSENEDDATLRTALQSTTESLSEVTIDPAAANAAAATDRRMARLMASRNAAGDDEADEESDDDARGVKGGSRAVPEPNYGGTPVDEDEAGEEAEMERRKRMRELAMRRRKEEEEREEREREEREKTGQGLDEEEEEEEESEYESSDDDVLARPTLLKPVFVPKAHRETVAERERLLKEEEDAAESRKAQQAERANESRDLAERAIELAMKEEVEAEGPPDIDDTDGLDEEAEYEAWKLRELRRIKRDREEAEQLEKEEAEKERRRNMTDAEVIAENAEVKPEKDKGKYRFLQKYFHKGAFYNDDDVLERDFNEPTLEDKFDKTILPEVMQVKKFGRAGQTKWTHLTNEDTSIGDSAWFQKNDFNKRMSNRQAGMEQSFEKPTKRARR
ncbi:Microfibrillar-associated protein 1 [Irineochytrium annulatum]|nr:Microfibrillar-associated protein 1 [Irineochytrium annulatum]